MEGAPRLSVIVPAHDAEATLGRALACLGRQTVSDGWELIVVDDGSSDGTAALAAGAEVELTLISQPRAGPATARNAGAAAARGEVLAFLDADCFPTPGWLAAGLDAIGSADLVQGAVLPDPETRLGPFDRTLWVTDDSGLYQTANLFITRAAFEAAGGFSDWIDPGRDSRGHFGEDVAMAWRARRRGASAAFSADALVHHAIFPRSPTAQVAERARLRYFPGLAREVPELRRGPFFGRLFLSRRTAAFDLAVASLLAWLLTGWAPAAAGIVPYAVLLGAGAAPWRGRRALAALAVAPFADLTGLAALIAGSLRYRRPVL